MIAIQNHTATSTDMRPNAERLLNNRVAIRTFLAGIVRWYGDDRDLMQEPIAGKPLQENSPSCIMDRLGKLPVADHILHLKVFMGNQVVRRDKRVCLLSGKILTLPLDFQMLLRQLLAGFLSMSRFLLLAGKSPLESFKPVFSFTIVPGIGDGIALGVGQEALETNINPQLRPRWNMLNFAFGIDAELTVVAVCPSNYANSLDHVRGKFLDALIGIANQFEATNPTAIGEDDVSAISVKLPPRGFVLDAPVVVLKLWISLFPWFLLLAIVIEARDSKLCTGGCCLTSHRVEATSKGILLGKHFTVGLQVVLGDVLAIHPQPQAFVADELDGTNGFINGSILFLGAIKLVLVDQHALLLLSRIWVYHITYINIQIFMIEERKMNILLCMRIFPLCPSPKKGTTIHLPLKRQGLSRPLTVRSFCNRRAVSC